MVQLLGVLSCVLALTLLPKESWGRAILILLALRLSVNSVFQKEYEGGYSANS